MTNNAMNNRVLDTINSIANGQMGVVVEMTTEPTWASVKSPYKGRVVKHTRIANIAIGVCYTNVVESHSDNKEEEYIPSAPKGMHYPTNDKGEILTYKYLISNNNPDQLYLNLIYRGNEKKSEEWYLDGAKVTDNAIIEDIKAYIRPNYAPKKQFEHGVPKDKIVVVNRPKFENVAFISQGDRVIYRREDKVYSIAI